MRRRRWTLLVEVDDDAWRQAPGGFIDKLKQGVLSEHFFNTPMPAIHPHGDDEVYIWHSIEPFVPHKRVRADV